MTNLLVCHAGTNELATQLPDNIAITEIKIVGACSSNEITILSSTWRGQFITALTLDSQSEKTTLQEHARLVKKLLHSGFQFSQSLLNSALELAITLMIEMCRQDPKKAAHALNIAKAVIEKNLDEKIRNQQLDRLVKCEVPVPVKVVSALLQAGAKSTVKNSDGHSALNELLRSITTLDKAKSTDKELWKAKFGYLQAIIENGDMRISNYKQLLEIAKYHGVTSIIAYLHDKQS